MKRCVAVRLEGGLGDHILGMRILPFVRGRFPAHELVVYSDAGGNPVQLEAAALAPQVDRVVAARQKIKPTCIEEMGRLENLDDDCLREMRSADAFIDAWGAGFFLSEAMLLGVPVFDILARRPDIVPPEPAQAAAAHILRPWQGAKLVGLNVAKYGSECLQAGAATLKFMLTSLLADPEVVVLNLYASRFDFTHWPKDERRIREQVNAEEVAFIKSLNNWHERIVAVPDQAIATVAALLGQCRYFIGVDNGIKHLAWALDVPRTVFAPGVPDGGFILRWMPDFHRLLLFSPATDHLRIHIETAQQSLGTQPVNTT